MHYRELIEQAVNTIESGKELSLSQRIELCASYINHEGYYDKNEAAAEFQAQHDSLALLTKLSQISDKDIFKQAEIAKELSNKFSSFLLETYEQHVDDAIQQELSKNRMLADEGFNIWSSL
jgi:hypothetical protein